LSTAIKVGWLRLKSTEAALEEQEQVFGKTQIANFQGVTSLQQCGLPGWTGEARVSPPHSHSAHLN
jgi:hypothetical protein